MPARTCQRTLLCPITQYNASHSYWDVRLVSYYGRETMHRQSRQLISWHILFGTATIQWQPRQKFASSATYRLRSDGRLRSMPPNIFIALARFAEMVPWVSGLSSGRIDSRWMCVRDRTTANHTPNHAWAALPEIRRSNINPILHICIAHSFIIPRVAFVTRHGVSSTFRWHRQHRQRQFVPEID